MENAYLILDILDEGGSGSGFLLGGFHGQSE